MPSHDTFRRLFSLLSAEAFPERFGHWVEGGFTVQGGQVVAIDGNTVRVLMTSVMEKKPSI
jgi:hypothetical protein